MNSVRGILLGFGAPSELHSCHFRTAKIKVVGGVA